MLDMINRFSMDKIIVTNDLINIIPEIILTKFLHNFPLFNLNIVPCAGYLEPPLCNEYFDENDEIIISQVVANLSHWEIEFRSDDFLWISFGCMISDWSCQ